MSVCENKVCACHRGAWTAGLTAVLLSASAPAVTPLTLSVPPVTTRMVYSDPAVLLGRRRTINGSTAG